MKFVTEIRKLFVFVLFMFGFFVEGLNLRNRKYQQEIIVGSDIVEEMNNKEKSKIQLQNDIEMKEANQNQNINLNNLINLLDGSDLQDFQSDQVMNNMLNVNTEGKEKINKTNNLNVIEGNDFKLDSVIEDNSSSLRNEVLLNNNQSKLSQNITQEEQEITDVPQFQGENNLNNYNDITNHSEKNFNSKITILNFTIDNQIPNTTEEEKINSNYNDIIKNHIGQNETNPKSILQNKANNTLVNTTNNDIYNDFIHTTNTSKIPFKQKGESKINNQSIHNSHNSDYKIDEIIYTNNQSKSNKPNKSIHSNNNLTTINISNNNTSLTNTLNTKSNNTKRNILESKNVFPNTPTTIQNVNTSNNENKILFTNNIFKNINQTNILKKIPNIKTNKTNISNTNDTSLKQQNIISFNDKAHTKFNVSESNYNKISKENNIPNNVFNLNHLTTNNSLFLPTHSKEMPRNIFFNATKTVNLNNISSTNLNETLKIPSSPKGRISSNSNNENEIIYENVEIVKELSPESKATISISKYNSNK